MSQGEIDLQKQVVDLEAEVIVHKLELQRLKTTIAALMEEKQEREFRQRLDKMEEGK